MDSMQTSPEKVSDAESVQKEQELMNNARIASMVTQEQVLSDNVARKRRKFTKKRSTSAGRREPTPARIVDDKNTTSDDEVPKPRPKTPERRKRTLTRSADKRRAHSESESEMHGISIIDPSYLTANGKTVQKSYSIPKNYQEDAKKRGSITDIAQTEILSFINKTRKSITNAAIRGRDRFRKDKERVKRSQSAPNQITEEELVESFRKAQLLSAENVPKYRKYSDDASYRSVTPEVPPEPKQFRPEVQEFVRQRKQQREFSSKIVEVLDPKTSKVVSRKAFIKPTLKFRELFHILKMFTIPEIYRNYRAYKVEMKDEYNRIWRLWNKCMCEILIIMIYCGLGGFIFRFTEGSFENFYKCGVKRVKRDFIDQLWAKSHNLREEDWKSLARMKLRGFEDELHVAHEAGMTSYSGQRSWSFLNAVVYCITVVTTIGYGHIYPTTTTGRVLTIVYSIIGIPLFLIALTDFGKLFTRAIKFIWSFVRRLYYTGSCRSMRKTAQVQEIFKGAQMMYDIATFRRSSQVVDPENPIAFQVGSPGSHPDETPTTPALSNYEIDDEFNLPISVAIFILLLYIFLGALIYCAWEHWDFFASFYFVFISMSTIGFGDFVPRHPICMIVSIVYLVFGLALMSMCINVVQVKLTNTFKQASVKIGATMGLTVDEDGSVCTIPPEGVEMPEVHDNNTLQVPTEDSGIKVKDS
ncbi:unnamed protein product [Brassicogethes aeneus]|uniref:Potassium channel domain-containing protein n=1 Tax=Brassicogethes aeneus TaxID=1431903 RepID=A0A9P0FI66_BRAAE|nr:unnamed protein product [Brassicogethes aeneus]